MSDTIPKIKDNATLVLIMNCHDNSLSGTILISIENYKKPTQAPKTTVERIVGLPETDQEKVLRMYDDHVTDIESMWKLFDKIYKNNPDAFPHKSETEAREELFDMVTKAYFDGNPLPFGRLFNETFGKGMFKSYGHLQTIQEILNFVDTLEDGPKKPTSN